MKKFADKLTNEFNRRKTDKMCMCEKVLYWWKTDKFFLVNIWLGGIAGGLTVAVIFIVVAIIYLWIR